MCLCVCCICAHVCGYPRKPIEGVECPGAVVTGSCELSDVGARNCKRNEHSVTWATHFLENSWANSRYAADAGSTASSLMDCKWCTKSLPSKLLLSGYFITTKETKLKQEKPKFYLLLIIFTFKRLVIWGKNLIVLVQTPKEWKRGKKHKLTNKRWRRKSFQSSNNFLI